MNIRNVLLTKTSTVPAYRKTRYVHDSGMRLDLITLHTSELQIHFLSGLFFEPDAGFCLKGWNSGCFGKLPGEVVFDWLEKKLVEGAFDRAAKLFEKGTVGRSAKMLGAGAGVRPGWLPH